MGDYDDNKEKPPQRAQVIPLTDFSREEQETQRSQVENLKAKRDSKPLTYNPRYKNTTARGSGKHRWDEDDASHVPVKTKNATSASKVTGDDALLARQKKWADWTKVRESSKDSFDMLLALRVASELHRESGEDKTFTPQAVAAKISALKQIFRVPDVQTDGAAQREFFDKLVDKGLAEHAADAAGKDAYRLTQKGVAYAWHILPVIRKAAFSDPAEKTGRVTGR